METPNQHPWVYVTSRFVALGHDFAVRTTEPALGRYVEQLFAPFVAPGPARHLYSLLRTGSAPDFRHSLLYDSEVLETTPSARFVFSTLVWHINRLAAESCENYLLIHAAAAESQGCAVLMPARMESGKTTLVAGLLRAGLRYLTDEVAAIDPDSLLVHPFPKALSVDVGSWKILADLEPVVEPEVRPYLGRKWHVNARSIRADAVGTAVPIRLIVIPSYQPASRTELTRIRPAQALLALCENSFNLDRYRSAGLNALAAIVKQSECYRLTMNDLDAACEAVLAVLSVKEQELTGECN